MSERKQIMVQNMCDKHNALLVKQANYKKTDSWQSLLVVSNIVLFQAATADPKTHEKIGKDITQIGKLGCLACYKPDVFGEIVEAAKSHDLGKIKAIGEAHLAKANMKMVTSKDEE